jgi:Tfp pilus assembly protein PilF
MIGKEKLRTLLVCLALAAGTAILYAPVLGFEFINFDDIEYIVNNYHIRHFNWQSLAWCFQTTYASNWHPLTWMSHTLDCQLFGMRAGGHHATSVVLHILNSILLFIVLRRMTGAFWRSAMVAALFAWHPLRVESVAWIAERKDVLSTLFWMLAIWAHVRYTEECRVQNAKCRVFYAVALLLFALGLMAKPMLVTLPFVLLLLDWWPLGRLRQSKSSPKSPGGKAPGRPGIRLLLIEKTPFFLLSAISCFLTIYAQNRAGAIQSLVKEPIQLRLSNALVAYCQYIGKLIWPESLSVIYFLDNRLPDWEPLAAGLFLVAITAVAVRLWKTRPYFLIGWLWFLGTLVPVIGVVQVGSQAYADRYAYIPSIGFFIILCWGVYDFGLAGRCRPVLIGALAWVALGSCVMLTSRQLSFWKNSEALFRHAIEVSPDNPIARANYAAYLCEAHRFEPAVAECNAAFRLSPDDGLTHHVLGKVLYLQGKLDQAIPELYAALRVNPNNYLVHLILGNISLLRHSLAEAAGHASIVIAADPANPEAHCILGQALGGQGKLDQACAQFAEALRLAPQYADAHHHFAVALAAQHQAVAAISHYRAALALEPDRLNTLNNLAWLLATDPRPENRDGAGAVRLASRLCELTRRQGPFFLGTLAAAYAEAGRFDDAAATAQEAHDLALKLAGQAHNPAEEKSAKDLAARNLELLEIYRSRQPYHEE